MLAVIDTCTCLLVMCTRRTSYMFFIDWNYKTNEHCQAIKSLINFPFSTVKIRLSLLRSIQQKKKKFAMK